MSRRGGHEPDPAGDLRKLRLDSPTFRPGPGASGPPVAAPNGPATPARRFTKNKFNPQRTFQVPKSTTVRKFNPTKTFSPSSSPFSAPGSPAAAAASPAPNQAVADRIALYHPPLHPLQYHLYAPTPFRTRQTALNGPDAHERVPEDLFLNNQLREELQERNEATLQVLSASTLPDYVHVYHSLVPLDVQAGSAERFGHPTWRYKAVSNADGRTYCLLRVDGFQLRKEHALQTVNKWKRVVSASVVGVVEAFTTLAFGTPALVVVYEYWPLARPLASVYEVPPPEGLMWALAAQLYGAVQAVHKRQLAVRVLDAKRVLVTQKDRVRLGSCGVLDVVEYDDSGDYSSKLAAQQRQDWCDLAATLRAVSAPLAVDQKYSADFVAFVDVLDSAGDPLSEDPHTILSQRLAPHLWRVLDGALSHNDELEDVLGHELENSRLVRLLAKLEYALDRPEHAEDSRWAVDGPYYPLRLFKHFAFHTRDEQGRPVLNLAHALGALNKLDAGVDENLLLVSGDEQTRIIISYKDVKRMLDQVFAELRK